MNWTSLNYKVTTRLDHCVRMKDGQFGLVAYFAYDHDTDHCYFVSSRLVELARPFFSRKFANLESSLTIVDLAGVGSFFVGEIRLADKCFYCEIRTSKYACPFNCSHLFN